MKEKVKTISLLIIFVALLIIISVLMNLRNNNLKESNKNNSEQLTELAIEVNGDNFVDEVIDSDKKVMIDFYATWCGPCKVLSPILEEVARENDDIKLVKIDVDENEDLVYEYGITAMPTLVIIENGAEVNRSVGVISKDRVLKLLDK